MTEEGAYVCTREVLRTIMNIGVAKERLSDVIENIIPENLSKHDPYWDSEHEVENDKLYDCRMKFSHLQEKLWDIYSLLNMEE